MLLIIVNIPLSFYGARSFPRKDCSQLEYMLGRIYEPFRRALIWVLVILR